jgi:hypothetical protein
VSSDLTKEVMFGARSSRHLKRWFLGPGGTIPRVTTPLVRYASAPTTPGGLLGCKSILIKIDIAQQPAGTGDRGAGLCYRMQDGPGRLGVSAGARVPTDTWEGPWVVKVQSPIDNSADSAGGIGRMMPDTLLLHDESHSFVYFVPEEATGHSTLLRAALKQRSQVAHLYAEQVDRWKSLRIYTELLPDDSTDTAW